MKHVREMTIVFERRRTRKIKAPNSMPSCPHCGGELQEGTKKQTTLDEIKAKKWEDCMKNKPIICLLLVMGFFCLFQSHQAWGCQNQEGTLTLAVELRPGVSSNVNLTVLANPNLPCGGRTLLAIPGGFMTGETMRPLAAALFENHKHWPLFVSKVVLVNLPGHGGSSYPTNMPFRMITLEDYANSLFGILDQLKKYHLDPDVVMGHCMTATLLQVAQQQLISQGTNLRKEYGIQEVLMLAPDPPSGVTNTRFLDPNFVAKMMGMLSQSIVQDPQLGPIVKVIPAGWLGMFFTGTNPANPGPVPNTPFDFMAKGYYNIEPLTAFLETIGFTLDSTGKMTPGTQPIVDAGAFDRRKGTCLRLLAFKYDFLIAPEDQQSIYRFLTGDDQDRNFAVIEKDDAIHAMFISNPEAVAQAWLELSLSRWNRRP